ncbi:MAG: allantoinase AllB [Anaerolineae bacterium]
MVDTIIRQARVIDSTQDLIADVAITEGLITGVLPSITDNAPHEIDASGKVLLPGGIDPHVHFNDPGRTDWEGIASGSRALAKGGMTSFFDMPLNASPPTLTAEAYHAKRQIADRDSVVNAYLWGGLTPDNLDHLEELLACGVVGFKAFMSNSGIDDFASVDDDTLYQGMCTLAPYGAIVAVHAENDTLTARQAQRAIVQGHITMRDYLQSRPVIAELEAIQRAILFAQETECKLHIVHVSSARGVALVTEARQCGVDVTCETCPHYLVLTDADAEELGAVAKCAPPLRSADEQDALWKALLSGDIPIIASDHSPAPMSLKKGDNFFTIWGGIAGCQSTLSLLITEGYHRRGMSLQQIVRLTSANTAQRFGLTGKGGITLGMDADLALWDLDASAILQADDLAYQHRISPYIGRNLYGKVHRIWVGGHVIYG